MRTPPFPSLTFLAPLALLALEPPAPSLAAPRGGPVLMHQPTTRFDLAADSVVVPMKREDGRIIVDVTLDGKGPFPFIFDTGAHGSVMDLAFAREQKLSLGQEVTVASPSGGGLPGHLTTIGTVGIGGLTLHDLPSVAFDGMPFPKSATSPRGVLGPYSLSGLLVTLDYPGKRLVFRRGALPEPDGREVFGWDRARGLPEIPATVAGQSVRVHLDSGSSGGIALPTDFTARLPLETPLAHAGYAKAVDRVEPVTAARLRGAFTIGRYTLDDPTLRFLDIDRDVCNVGAAVLSQFALTIDPANARLRLAGPESGHLEAVPEKPHYGLQLEALEGSPLKVLAVDAGSAAEKGGLRSGDQIVRMNGQPVEAIAVDDRLMALRDSTLQVTVKRADASLDLTMTLK